MGGEFTRRIKRPTQNESPSPKTVILSGNRVPQVREANLGLFDRMSTKRGACPILTQSGWEPPTSPNRCHPERSVAQPKDLLSSKRQHEKGCPILTQSGWEPPTSPTDVIPSEADRSRRTRFSLSDRAKRAGGPFQAILWLGTAKITTGIGKGIKHIF
jgi:hypothetical protein